MNPEDARNAGVSPPAELRRQAEQRLRAGTTLAERPMAESDVRALLHELQVHQIELEMQNEELQRAHTAAQEASERYYELFDFAPVGYFVWDHEGRIQEVNLAGTELLGLNRKALVQKRFGEFVAMESRPAFADFCRKVLASDAQQHCEITLLKNGQPVVVLVEGIAAQERQEQGNRCCAAVVDITPQKRAKELSEANRALQAEIVARKCVEEELSRAKEAAEAANLAKSRFLANMSHELRTPMNAILGMIDVASQKAVDPTVMDCLQTAKGSADLLLTLLNDLLDSAKIESGKLDLELASFSLRQMLEQTTRALSVRAAEKGLSFACRMPDDIPAWVMGDRMRLQQVLLNLAGNAIKFTHEGEVEICVSTLLEGEEACLEFAVRDTGIGIPPAELERIFEPFAQGDVTISRRFGGTGLGLAISKNLVEMMGGRIWAESDEGRGSTFAFSLRLPLANERSADSDLPASLSQEACSPLQILIVEDNPANQKLAAYVLRDRGHFVEFANDGREALAAVQHKGYDVILMDVQMPGLDGLQATSAIRKQEAGGCRVPIIAMTAYAQKVDRERCLASGMDAYLSKPVGREELIALVERLGAKGEDAGPTAACLGDAQAVSEPIDNLACPRSDGSTTSCFNLDDAMARIGSLELFREMVVFLFNEGLQLAREIHAGAERGDAKTIEVKAHRLHGTLLYLGAEAASQAVAEVEALARSGGLAEAAAAIPVMDAEVTRLTEALRPYAPAVAGHIPVA